MSPKASKKSKSKQEEQQAVTDIDIEAAENLDLQAADEEQTIEEAEAHIQDEIAEAEKKAEENWQLLLRTKAEMENLRKRTHKDLENAHKFAIEKFVSELLPIKDSMELGLQNDDADIKTIREGLKLTMNMLDTVFEKFKITEIDPINEKFDPELHQAMTMQPTDEVEPNTVITVMQKGYLLNDRLVRPAMVMVSRAPAAEDE